MLTFNREKYIARQLMQLSELPDTEIIVVDNCSDDKYADRLAEPYDNVRVIRLNKNYGAVGRNFGIKLCSSPYIITLDDDVWGITPKHLQEIEKKFAADNFLDCICFSVIDEKTKETTNWIHHRHKHLYQNREFNTYEISEGAAAFKRGCFERVGLYPEEFFISHEGPDLAFRILNSGKKIIYFPEVVVVHAHAQEGRANWRRYYYDTRNLIWLAYRNYNLSLLVTRFPLQLSAMFVYSVRDGYLKYYFKAIWDAVLGIRQHKWHRSALNRSAYIAIKEMDKARPSIFYYIKERLFKTEIKL